MRPLLLFTSLLASSVALAQPVYRADQDFDSAAPEAWAMNYVAASTLMTSFGEAPSLAPGQWRFAADLGHVPSLSADERRVGLGGSKEEDLNKSPVFGRIRAMVGLPGGFYAEAGYTPPLLVSGARPLDLFALAVGGRIVTRDRFSLSARVFGQHGRAHGDITCPARLANAPPAENPYGCLEPSNDRIVLNYYGVDATGTWKNGPWRGYATLGAARTELEVQLDALTVDFRERSVLTARGSWPFAALGASRDFDARWNAAVEWLYVPLKVRRDPASGSGTDPFSGVRFQLAYRFG